MEFRPHRRPHALPGMVATVVVLLAGAPWGTAAQEPVPVERIDRLLERSRTRTLLAGAAAQVWSSVAEIGVALPEGEEARIMDAMAEEFTVPLLYRDLSGLLLEEATPGEVADLLDRLESGASARVRELMDGHEPPLSLDAFIETVTTSPPPRERLDLVLQWTEAQGTADFHLLVGEAGRQAAHDIVNAALGAGIPFVPRPAEEVVDLRATLLSGAFLSFLRQLEPVPDSLLEEAIRDHLSPSGQWFVEQQALGVAVAIRRAGERVADRLQEEEHIGAPGR